MRSKDTVRSATALVLVGAGGTDVGLTNNMSLNNCGQMFAIIFFLVALITLTNRGSAPIRKRLNR